ncbi:uncharacterized protein LOC107416087 [Ziziphus jujuba]|uniref:Uncharacterized protein LOC107416087 n=2 Tax=Ziziphus jujuba TaxID=326968 RepID=A0A6P3ZLW9_ZIZJJ|nr:uncharacterized protein LOC107416087 [Ziziphus jujuba]KAH7533925.1 hypothetical protein FEM48_Zijuj04G0183300 [Ziziphus jujuba var. spinosa]
MKTKSKNNNSLWDWKGNNLSRKRNSENRFTEFLNHNIQKAEGTVLGPGGGAGFGCGAGVGFGLVGGFGFGGWPWNHLKLVFGVGMGCGVGLGFGYGQGIGYGFSLDSLRSFVSKQSSDSEKGIVF